MCIDTTGITIALLASTGAIKANPLVAKAPMNNLLLVDKINEIKKGEEELTLDVAQPLPDKIILWEAESKEMVSHSITIRPVDSRCRYWAKIFRLGVTFPSPDCVQGALDLPGDFHHKGDEELFYGDFLIEGEEMHHRKARGWCYHLTYINNEGELVRLSPNSNHKKQLKEQGLKGDYLKGSGDLAAIVRIIHGLKSGLKVV